MYQNDGGDFEDKVFLSWDDRVKPEDQYRLTEAARRLRLVELLTDPENWDNGAGPDIRAEECWHIVRGEIPIDEAERRVANLLGGVSEDWAGEIKKVPEAVTQLAYDEEPADPTALRPGELWRGYVGPFALEDDVTYGEITIRTPTFRAMAAVLDEREFQEAQWGQAERHLTQGEELLLAEQYLFRARARWTNEPISLETGEISEPSQHELRKVAAICLRALEHHGAPCRGWRREEIRP